MNMMAVVSIVWVAAIFLVGLYLTTKKVGDND